MTQINNLELFKRKAELCKTFSDPKRLMILNELRNGERSVSDLVEALQAPQAVVSRHLSILRNHGVVTTRREGVCIYYRLVNLKIIEACDIVHEIMLELAASDREKADRLMV